MPIGPFGEIIGTTGTLECLSDGAQHYKSKVIAPRNPKLVKGEMPEFKMKPSQFIFQMGMNTEQKLANMHTMNVPRKIELLDMSETTHQKISTVNIDEAMFQPFPSEIIFQNFEPFETYEIPLVLRNGDKVPRLVKVTQAESPYFKIISPHNVGHKVGPGLPTTFRVQFTPDEKKDYQHELVCITEREKFTVPVRAIGARAILDFPDEVNFPIAPVKYQSTKTLLVRNIGNREAKFTLITDKPFTVSPDNGVIAVNESIQVTVDFKPLTCGDHNEDLIVSYDTGEDIYISLYGAAQDGNVRLDKNSIRIENTFISMANQRTVTISNRTNVIAHYRWTQYATLGEEEQQKMMFCDNLNKEESTERDRFMEECLADPSLGDKMSILNRTFQNRKKLVLGDKLVFNDEVVKIDPPEGDIWPNSSMEVTVIFKPDMPKTYSCTAFCDITGRESRLPLRIKGDGVGPQVQFSYDELDMGNIFVNSTHTYEVVLANKGDIDAIFNFIPNKTVFGSCFQFNPSEGIVMPEGHQAIQMSFSSATLGDFEEEFYFQIDGSPSKLKLIFSGSVIGPTFDFDVPKLKFGTVSYGFVNTQTCTLSNTALVPMTFTLRVPGDGVGESMCSTSEYDSTVSSDISSVPPKEFEIVPASGTLAPQSETTIKVDLCSNTIKKYDLALVVDVKGVGDEILTLPIVAKCIVPQVTVLTPILDYGRCFLRHPYEHTVRLQNDTALQAKYELATQHIDEFTSILYSSPQPKGIIEPHAIMDVPLIITPQALEEIETTAFFTIFGNAEAPLPVHLSCIGEGPVVHIMPLDMDWGQVSVLTDIPKIIRLSNESLIPAKFTAHMVRPSSVWRVEPSSGEIPPESQLDLTVTACLDDCVRFQDKLQINFLDGPSRTIPLTGYGNGTTIVTDPVMSPVLNLGPHFSKGPCIRTFTLTNSGRRHQSLVWSTEGFSFVQKPVRRSGGLAPINHKDMKFKDNPPPPDPPRPIFKLTPHRMELNPGESIDVTLEGYVDIPQIVREKMLCHAIIGRAGGKELIMKVQINCEFISPLLEFSADNVFFRVDKQPEDKLEVEVKELALTNVSSLPLTAQLSLNYPFQILTDDEEPLSKHDVSLGIGETKTVNVMFDPAYKDDGHIRIIDESLTVAYKEHPHSDNIVLRGEVYFPNLQFEKDMIDFGCILNDTEVTRYVNITNNSPMEVKYKWSFLLDDEPVAIFHKPPSPAESQIELQDLENQGSVQEEEVVEVEVNIEGAHSPREADHIEDNVVVKEDMYNPDEDGRRPEDGEEKKDAEKTELEEDMAIHAECTDLTAESLEVKDSHMADDHKVDRLSLAPSRPDSRMMTTREEPVINPTLAALLEQDNRELTPLGVEEIFDILPLYGTLKPGDTEQITLTFYGHAHIGGKAKAICEVEGGPTYEIMLKGEASLVDYRFDCLDIDYGKIMYDQVAMAEITLQNTGRVGFEFTALGMDPAMAAKPKPGHPVMFPHTGNIEPLSQETLTIKFLPGIPEHFHKSFEIQVAHFEPDTVNLFGEGVFPRISLDLPRIGDEDGSYETFVKEAKENLTKETKKKVAERPVSAVSNADNVSHHEAPPSELEVQMEVERLYVEEFFKEQEEYRNRPDVLEVHSTQPSSVQTTKSGSSKKHRKQKPKPRLPDYQLDFGHVVLGTVRTHIVRATNTGWFPVSFSVFREYLFQFGFNVELDRVRALPGAPDHETVDFVVSFDPRGANLGLGEMETFVPINIVNGPQVCIRLKANVTMPDMQISTDLLDFEEVKCGESKVITVQLYNHKPVRCEWNSLPTDTERKKEIEDSIGIDKHVPMHLRRKMRQEKSKPRTFEMMPHTGSLMPGQRQNVQVKFMPTEEKSYENRISIRLAQSSQRIMLLCRGQGLEPRVEFERNLVEFGPILPHSSGDEQDIILRNPCKFPVEIYNLEFDKTFLEEEKILRLMKGYDEYNTILLPPRNPSEKLPQELLEYYEEQMRKLEEAERIRREAEEAAEAARREQEEKEAAENAAEGEKTEKDDDSASKADTTQIQAAGGSQSHGSTDHIADGAKTDRSDGSKTVKSGDKEVKDEKEEEDDKAGSSVGVGELEITPVSAAIARHLGIDLSPEGKAARNRRGMAVFVHGAPMSGKTSTAVMLAKKYGAALLTVNGVVLEAISNGNTPAGLRARELCSEAAARRAEELRAMDGEDGEKKAAGGLSVEALTAHTQGTTGVPMSIGQIAAAHSVAQSLVSNRKTSTISDQKSKDKHHGSTIGGKAGVAASSGEGGSQDLTSSRSQSRIIMSGSQSQLTAIDKSLRPPRSSATSRATSRSSKRRMSVSSQRTQSSNRRRSVTVGPSRQGGRKTSTGSRATSRYRADKLTPYQEEESDEEVPSSPPPLIAPIARRLSVSASVAGEQGLMSCVLPEEILIELLAERLMLNDCHRGVVFDGLETLFSQNMYSTAHAILKALNNRKYIYFVTLKLEYSVMKEQEKKAKEEAEKEALRKEEEERLRLEDMSEDEYDALSEEAKSEVDTKRLHIKKERLQREREERAERERIEAEKQKEEEERRVEEEKLAKKKKRNQPDAKDGKKGQATGKAPDSKSQDRVAQLKSQDGKKGHSDSDHHVGKSGSGTERPESQHTEGKERGESAADDGKKKKEKGKDGKRPISNEGEGRTKGKKGQPEPEEPPAEEPPKDPKTEADLLLMQRFRTFNHGIKDIIDLVDNWERSTASIRPITPSDGNADPQEEHTHPPSGKKGKKMDKHDKVSSKDTKSEKAVSEKGAKSDNKDQLPPLTEPSETDGEGGLEQSPILSDKEKRQKRLQDGIGIPHIMLDCSNKEDEKPVAKKVLEDEKFPSVEEVMDGLGLGPQGPPIPPPAGFSVVPYPVKRHAPPGAEGGHYVFVASGPDDPNVVAVEEKAKEEEEDDNKSLTPEGREKDHVTPTSIKGKKGEKEKVEKGGKGARKTSADKKKAGRRTSMQSVSPPPGAPTPASETEGSTADTALQEAKTPKLNVFRWVIPAEGEVTLRLRFTSEDLGQFDQTLNFEIVGTRRRYQLYCRGICAFPTISREPRIVFPHRKKGKKLDEIVHKKYILTNETFDFGPLLVGKPRDKRQEGRYPENMEKLIVLNTSPLEADISFCFLNDSKGDTYLLEPPTMVLKPQEQQELTIWAYPKQPGTYEDALVCCVKENPEPIIFKVVSYGVRPELELDKKVLHFDKVLLHRKDTKTLYLRNSTMLPVRWRLNGLESLGEDFSVSQESGVIEPKSEFALHAYFRAMKAVNTNKKAVRLEVYDVDNIMGLVQTENIQVHAEAYDVALDMSFPKGADGGIDFDVIRVLEEAKQTCSLKNKGKYDIAYLFSFEPTEACQKEICDMFSVIPQKGTLSPVDRPAQVQVIFRSNKEVGVKDQPILRCQVIEPSVGEEGETIASIPIKLSVRSVFSKYTIFPQNDINFGSMLVNSKKNRIFTIENKGDRFDFKYTITKMIKDTKKEDERKSRPAVKGDKRSKSRDGSSSGRSATKAKRAESISDQGADAQAGAQPSAIQVTKADSDKHKQRKPSFGNSFSRASRSRQTSPRNLLRQEVGTNQSRLVIGMFSIFPAFGYILPGGSQAITVECVAENPGRSEEDIAIDITGRDPQDHPSGIPYRLIAEACVPAINVTDVGSIFEEHRICKNLSIWQQTHSSEAGGVFGEEENKFVFNNVLVGAKTKSRFKLTNTNKVPCVVLCTIKPIVTKHSAKFQDVFEVEPPRIEIAPHSHHYTTVAFCPPSMQHFSAVFEAAIDGVSQNQAKGRNLTFEVAGEGNLPRITILKPSVRNKKGQPLVLFRKNLIGKTETMPIHITNDGTLPSKVDIDMVDPDNVFTLKPTGDTQAVIAYDEEDGRKRPHTASVIIPVAETATFDVTYTPVEAQRSQAHVRLSVVNNQYEDSLIHMVGEGYEDEVTLDNINGIHVPIDPEQEEGNMADDDVQAAKSNHIRFGDCFINEPRILCFSMTNHSKTDCIRFQWPDHPQLKFSPQAGHLQAGKTKDMTATFKTDVPKTFEQEVILCAVKKITFTKPLQEVADWDDRVKTVKWVDVSAGPSSTGSESGNPSTPVLEPKGRPAKKKIVETEPEPPSTEVPDSARNIELLVSVVSDYSKCKTKVESIQFRDTLMFQTRVYEFQLSNKGSVTIDYKWQIVMENFGALGPRSVTFAATESRPPTAAGLVVRPDSSAERPSSSHSSVITDVAYCPFTIEPESGHILPGKKANFTVKFSPLDVNENEGRLICSVSNLEPGKQGPVIGLKARSHMPYCHFELEDSDYIRSARRNPELRGPGGAPPGTTLDPNTRVMEFSNIGVGVKNIRKFSIVNPTNQNYSYCWASEDEPNVKRAPDFKCLTPDGVIKSGKKTECAFEFNCTSLELVESFWRFEILEQNISVPFLLVGTTQDPNISLDMSHLNFKSLLIGHEAIKMVYIINGESQPFQFAFDPKSCHAPGHSASLIVEPMQGTLAPNSSLAVDVAFTPTSDKEVNFNVICHIKKKTVPLQLNVKAEGYSMNCLVLCEDSQGNKVELSSQVDNKINFGEVELNEKSIRNISIVNSGKFNFDYTWELHERTAGKESMVSITPDSGGVMFGEREICQLTFCPPRQVSLRGCDLNLKISNGPSYHIALGGSGLTPGLHFSFLSHNFGPCFVHRAGMPENKTVLRLTNRDKKEISVDCLYAPNSHLHHDFEAQVIRPHESADVNFTFYPREPVKYTETVTFEINGLSKQSVDVLGLGTEMKIEVADPRHKVVKFGALRVGQTMKKVVPIVNNSPAPITFHLGMTPSNIQLQDKSVLRISPTDDITLTPKGGTAKVEVVFSPRSRIPQFTEEVLLECAGVFPPLFVITGSCQGIEINLGSDALPFGAVVQKSSSSRKLVMTNSGDIGARFKWDAQKFAPDFSITPIEGYISPGMEVPFDVVFHPQEINNDIRYEGLRCSIEGFKKPLKLTLTGTCIAIPPSKEVIHFTTHVRHKETRNLMIANRTNQQWNLRPIIDGEYWTGPDTFSVEPQMNKQYELTYYPLTMTTEGKKHTGTTFFPLPDGTGLLFNLTGSADAPRPINKITRDVPCKTPYTEVFSVDNWLKKPQRFRVNKEMIRPDKLDPGTSVKGLDYIDVPGNAKRDYKLTFNAHKEGQSTLKIVFLNETTNEYQFYEVTFRAGRPGVISSINMVTPVRQSVQHTIKLENPLSQVVTFGASCNVSELLMPTSLSVPAHAEGSFNFEYLPLKVGETQGRLEFTCNDLGLYMYDLNLKATPAGPEKAQYFRTTLGTNHIQTAKFLNYAKTKTDYSCKIDSTDFHVDKTVAAAPGSSSGTEVAVEVTYEPSRIGESRGILTVSSSVGGDYTFPLFGTCIAPKPQGPFLVKAGSTTSITFRNVFPHTTPFIFQVDNPLFHVTKPGESIRARKDHRIVVGFDGNDSSSKASVMGKLTVSCAKSAGGATNAQWVYYLKGVTPEK